MTEPGPFQPVYVWLAAMVLGTIVIAGAWFAYEVIAPLIFAR